MRPQDLIFPRPEEIESCFVKLAAYDKESKISMISNNIAYMCLNLGNANTSFFKNPFYYILEKIAKTGQRGSIKAIIRYLNGKEELEKYVSLHFLNYVKEKGAPIPEVILHEMNKFPKENYLEKLMRKRNDSPR